MKNIFLFFGCLTLTFDGYNFKNESPASKRIVLFVRDLLKYETMHLNCFENGFRFKDTDEIPPKFKAKFVYLCIGRYFLTLRYIILTYHTNHFLKIFVFLLKKN